MFVPSFVRRMLPVSFVALLLLTSTGCKKAKSASVSGRVYFAENQPLPVGQVQFMGEGGMLGSSPITPDGRYLITNLPTGKVLIVVSTKSSGAMPGMLGGMPGMPGGGGPPGMPGGGGPPGMPGGGGPPGMPGGGGPPGMPGGGGPPGMPGGGGPPGMPGGGGPPGMIDVDKLPKEAKEKLAKIDEKYGSPQKSTLNYEVQSGEQTHDIILE